MDQKKINARVTGPLFPLAARIALLVVAMVLFMLMLLVMLGFH